MAALKSVPFLILILISAVLCLVKPSDDVENEPLLALVQQQAATIQTMQAQLTSLQTTVLQQPNIIADLGTKLNAVTSNLTNVNNKTQTLIK